MHAPKNNLKIEFFVEDQTRTNHSHKHQEHMCSKLRQTPFSINILANW